MYLLLAVLLGVAQAENGRTPTVTELETAIRRNRELIRFGNLHIDSECHSFDATGKKLQERAHRDVWFFGKQMRVSWMGYGPPSKKPDRVVHICVPFRSADDSLYYDDGPVEMLSAEIVIKSQNRNDSYNSFLIDPKALGLYPMPMYTFSHYKLGALLSRTNFKGAVSPKVWDGKPAFEVIYEALEDKLRATNTKIRMIVVPETGYGVPEVELSATYDGKSYEQITRVEVQQYGKSKIWFPRKLHFKKRFDGKLVQEDTTEITAANFDAPPNDGVFGLLAMDIPPGTPVRINFDGKSREWNGKEIVEKPRDKREVFSKQFPDLPPHSATGWFSPLLWTAAGLSLMGGTFVFLAWRRRRAGG